MSQYMETSSTKGNNATIMGFEAIHQGSVKSGFCRCVLSLKNGTTHVYLLQGVRIWAVEGELDGGRRWFGLSNQAISLLEFISLKE